MVKINGIRQVVGIVPIIPETKEIVLLSSRKHKNRWVFPKGGWEKGETQEEGALREAWEEGGIRGKVQTTIGEYIDYQSDGTTIKGNFKYFLVHVTDLEEEWPEKNQRERIKCSITECEDLFESSHTHMKNVLEDVRLIV